MQLPDRSHVFPFISLAAALICGPGCTPKDETEDPVEESVLAFSQVPQAFGSKAEYAVTDAQREKFLADAPKALAQLVDSAGGIAAGDVDGDADVDLVLVRGDRRAAIFLNQLDAVAVDPGFEEAAAAMSPDLDPFAVSPVLVDLVGDEKPDLLVAGLGEQHLVLFENHWPDPFEDVTEAVGLSAALPTIGFAVGDVDNDGDIDLFVGRYGNPIDSAEAAAGLLWLNDDKQTFFDASGKLSGAFERAPLGTGTEGVLAPNFVDLDSDGDLDLVLTGKRGATTVLRNNLFASDLQVAGDDAPGVDAGARDAGSPDAGGQDAATAPVSSEFSFELLPKLGGLTNIEGRGSAFGDIDHDGDIDWFVSGGAGTTSKSFASKLFINDDNTLTENADEAGVAEVGFGLGACTEDFNNDGLMDFLQVADANYLVDPAIADEASPRDSRAAFYLADYENPGEFDEVGNRYGLDDITSGRAVLCFDYDKDGDVDIVATALDQSAELYRNTLNPVEDSGANYFGLRLVFEGDNTAGLGARVELRAGGVTQMREVRLANGLFGTASPTVHFGLAAEPFVTELRITWPNGETVTTPLEYLNDWVRISYRAPD